MASLFKMDVKTLKGVGTKTAEALNNLNIQTVGDLINFYPREYEFWDEELDLNTALTRKNSCISIKIISKHSPIILKSGKRLYKLVGTNGFEEIEIIFFNNCYYYWDLKIGEEYLFKGNLSKGYSGNYEIISPKVKHINDETMIVPIYHQCKGITSNKIMSIMKNALELIPEDAKDTLPNIILKENNLCSLKTAIKEIHFPSDRASLKSARARIIFEEFFIHHLSMSYIKKKARSETEVVISKDFSEDFYNLLPFKISDAQRRSISECIKDMSSGISMNRLLQGDVGSGKTAVAAGLSYSTVKNGYQAVLMAPTELLAIQHYTTFRKFFEGCDINVRLVYGSMRTKQRRMVQEEILLGTADIIIGTHALISDSLEFKNIGLIITDEQHRFGVKQRGKLVNKGKSPHVLVMSATPIPRTLAMILYGDLDISVLDQVLPGRQKIDTFHIDRSKRTRMFGFIDKTISEGGQVYIVCAGIEENENDILDLESCKNMLVDYGFSEKDIDILHGKMSSNEKDYVMEKFIRNEFKILISTTVIEVGIDVPNATLMIIENAERFGISQLHQLRGRVGRGSKKSYCILVSDSKGKESIRRFNAMTSSSDGFYLSEEDLKMRGPGDFFGVNQHGVPNVKMSTSYEDIPTVHKAQKCAEKIMENEFLLEQPEFKFIKNKLSKLSQSQEDSESKNIVF